MGPASHGRAAAASLDGARHLVHVKYREVTPMILNGVLSLVMEFIVIAASF
jgi:hypothetical protein